MVYYSEQIQYWLRGIVKKLSLDTPKYESDNTIEVIYNTNDDNMVGHGGRAV